MPYFAYYVYTYWECHLEESGMVTRYAVDFACRHHVNITNKTITETAILKIKTNTLYIFAYSLKALITIRS